ncbi:hypothetical protein [Cedecea neteri]|nr:hypothetical protein [Cedecea neteri]
MKKKIKDILLLLAGILIIAYGFYSMQGDDPTYPIRGKIVDKG